MTPLTWVMVSFGTVDEANELAGRVRDLIPGVTIVVGCNGPDDYSIATHLTWDPGVVLVDSRRNPGYLGFLNEVSDRIPFESAIVLSNTDIALGDGFGRRIGPLLDTYSEAGMLAPSILTGQGADQNPHLVRPPSRRKLRILQAMHRFYLFADLFNMRARGHSARASGHAVSGQRIYAGHGSCMIFLPSYRRKDGRFDYPCFLFGEELWCGSECERIGLDVLYAPELEVRHREHSSTGVRRRGAVAAAKYESLKFWASSNSPLVGG